MTLPWVFKYQPTKITEFVGNSEAIRQLEKWLRLWEQQIPAKKCAFLHGPPGVGKTSSVYVLAKELDYDTVELNASDKRTRKTIERVVGMALSQSTLYGLSKRIVILDELEGITGAEDREGIGAIAGMIREALSPLVLIADDAWNPRFRELRNHCVLIEFKRIPIRSIASTLQKICREEGIEAEGRALQLIATRSGGDLRSAIIDLEVLSQNKKNLIYEEIKSVNVRERREAIFNVLRLVFNADNCIEARKAIEASDVKYEMLFEWIYENAPYQLTDGEDLYDAMDALAKADLYFNRIRTSQNWKLLPYALDLMTCAIAMSSKRTRPKWVPFKFPMRIRMMSRTMRDRRKKVEIGLKIGQKCHISAKRAITEYLPYLKIIYAGSNRIMASKIAEAFDFDTEAIKYLKNPK